jgi:hypothetical protein
MQQQTSERGDMRRTPGGVKYEALLESPRAFVLRATPDGDELKVTILPTGGGTVIADTAGDIMDFLIRAWRVIRDGPSDPGTGGGKKCGDVHVTIVGGSGTGGSGTGGTGGSGTGTGTGGGVGGGGAGAAAGTGGTGGTGGQGYGGGIEGITINYTCP